MDEKELIRQLKVLRQIKPRKDWVVLVKSRILPKEDVHAASMPSLRLFFGYKLAWAPVVSVLIIIGLFGFAQNTVPGDFLFSVKKVTESVQVGFTSNLEKPKIHLQLANKRLEELSKIAEANQVRNLSPAIEEFQNSFAQAAEELAKMDVNVTSSDSVFVKELATQMQELEKNKQEVRACGIEVGDTEKSEDVIIAYLIKDLENRTLTEEDQKLLEEAKEYYEVRDYSQALIKILYINK